MNRAFFFDTIRPMFGGLSKSQVAGTEEILDEFEAVPGLLLRHQSYMLGTTAHETAMTMRPIEEIGRGRHMKYGAPAGPYGQVYYGRGFVQLTWLQNYEKARRELGADFVQHPELALDPQWAARIMIRGMLEGWFTGKKLADYFDDKKSDWLNARRIINGKDQAAKIAGHAQTFYAALKGARE